MGMLRLSRSLVCLKIIACNCSMAVLLQTGKYVVRAEDLQRAKNCHARNGQSSAQNLKNIVVKRAGTYKKVSLHM